MTPSDATNPPQNPFHDWVDAYRDGTIDAADFALLEAELPAHESSRRYFATYMQLHAELGFATRAGQAAALALQRFQVNVPASREPEMPGVPDTNQVKQRWRGRSRWLAEGRVRTGGARDPPGSGHARTPGGQHNAVAPGAMTAQVPPAAHGFTVFSPQGKIVDLGTEFGLAVEATGTTAVRVYAGELAAAAGRGASGAIRLGQGQAAEIDEQGVRVQAAGDRRFTLRRVAGTYALLVENLTKRSTNALTIPPAPFLDGTADLDVGIFGANTRSDIRKTLTIRQVTITVSTQVPPATALAWTKGDEVARPQR